jgi:hypothetical protein
MATLLGGLIFLLPANLWAGITIADFSGGNSASATSDTSFFVADALFILDDSLTTGNLTITLTNKSEAPVDGSIDHVSQIGGAQTLTSFYFNNPQNDHMTAVSAAIGTTSQILGKAPVNIGQNWAYLTTTLTDPFTPENNALSTTGLFSGGSNPPASSTFYSINPVLPLGGPKFGIVGTNAVGHVASGITPVVSNQIVFTLTVASGFSLADLNSEVKFVYGTGVYDMTVVTGNLTGGSADPHSVTVPEPLSLSVWGVLGLAGIAFSRRRDSA